MVTHFPQLRQDLESHVRARTGRRLRNLDIELFPERIILHGQAVSFHVKQLAQQGVRDLPIALFRFPPTRYKLCSKEALKYALHIAIHYGNRFGEGNASHCTCRVAPDAG